MDPVLLLSFSEFFGDMGFIVKLFILVAILGFLNQHIENKILKVIVALFMIYVILFASKTLQFLYVVYAVMGMGISSIFVDYFFMNQGGHAEQQQEAMNMKNKAIMRKAEELGIHPQDNEGLERIAKLPEFDDNPKKGFLSRLFGGR